MTESLHCPRCGAPLEEAGAGDGYVCAACGLAWEGEPGAIIDVSATPVGGVSTQPEPLFDDPPQPRMHVRTYSFQRESNGGCCCPLGCLGLGLVMFLLLRGLLSLF